MPVGDSFRVRDEILCSHPLSVLALVAWTYACLVCAISPWEYTSASVFLCLRDTVPLQSFISSGFHQSFVLLFQMAFWVLRGGNWWLQPIFKNIFILSCHITQASMEPSCFSLLSRVCHTPAENRASNKYF